MTRPKKMFWTFILVASIFGGIWSLVVSYASGTMIRFDGDYYKLGAIIGLILGRVMGGTVLFAGCSLPIPLLSTLIMKLVGKEKKWHWGLFYFLSYTILGVVTFYFFRQAYLNHFV